MISTAVTYTQLFDPALFVSITIDATHDGEIATDQTVSWVQHVVEALGSMTSFLRLFVSLCSSQKLTECVTASPRHTVEVVDLTTIIVDGARISFNAPRMAALFTLAVIGTETVPVEAFARLYDNYLTGSTEVAIDL